MLNITQKDAQHTISVSLLGSLQRPDLMVWYDESQPNTYIKMRVGTMSKTILTRFKNNLDCVHINVCCPWHFRCLMYESAKCRQHCRLAILRYDWLKEKMQIYCWPKWSGGLSRKSMFAVPVSSAALNGHAKCFSLWAPPIMAISIKVGIKIAMKRTLMTSSNELMIL